MWLLEALTGFSGRLGRQRFWISLVVLVAIAVVLNLILFASGFGEASMVSGRTVLSTGEVKEFNSLQYRLPPPVSLFLMVIFAIPLLSIGLKRRHDRGSKGHDLIVFMALYFAFVVLQVLGILPEAYAIAFIGLINLAGIYLIVVLGFLRGITGENGYGPDPLTPPDKSRAWLTL